MRVQEDVRVPSRFVLVVLALAAGIAIGIAYENRGETYRVREVHGYISAISQDGDSVCLREIEPPAPQSEECQNPRLVPSDIVPPIGTYVRAGLVFLPTQETCCAGSWLYLIPEAR